MNWRKRIVILTSGGDCSGLNAAIRGVAAHGILTHDWQLVGIPYGSRGLAARQTFAFNSRTLDFSGA